MAMVLEEEFFDATEHVATGLDNNANNMIDFDVLTAAADASPVKQVLFCETMSTTTIYSPSRHRVNAAPADVQANVSSQVEISQVDGSSEDHVAATATGDNDNCANGTEDVTNDCTEQEPADDADEEYQVEKIIGRRVTGSQVEYHVKWLHFPDSDNTWNFREDLEKQSNWKELVEEFEKQEEAKRFRKCLKEGWKPEKIVGAWKQGGSYMFAIQWKGKEEASLVPSKVANVEIPQIVIKYYEKTIKWQK